MKVQQPPYITFAKLVWSLGARPLSWIPTPAQHFAEDYPACSYPWTQISSIQREKPSQAKCQAGYQAAKSDWDWGRWGEYQRLLLLRENEAPKRPFGHTSLLLPHYLCLSLFKLPIFHVLHHKNKGVGMRDASPIVCCAQQTPIFAVWGQHHCQVLKLHLCSRPFWKAEKLTQEITNAVKGSSNYTLQSVSPISVNNLRFLRVYSFYSGGKRSVRWLPVFLI